MKTIDRYILREIFIAFILSLAILLSTLLTQQMLRLSSISAETGISFFKLVRVIPLIIPIFLGVTIPLSVLISSTMTFSRLTTDLEITALRSGGLSIYRMLFPVTLFSACTFLITLLLSTTFQPLASKYLRLQSYEILRSERSLGIQGGVFNNLFNLLVYVREIKDGETMEGVLISDRSGTESRIITARQGRVLNDYTSNNMFLELKDGHIYFNSEDRSVYQLAEFSKYVLRIEADKSIEGIHLFNEVWSMGPAELKKKVEEKKNEGNERDYRKLLTEFHKKYSLPAAVLVLGILGVPLGIKSRFSRKFAGFIVSILVVLFYYIIDTGFELIAVEGIIRPVWAAWLPVVIYLLLAMYTIAWVSGE